MAGKSKSAGKTKPPAKKQGGKNPRSSAPARVQAAKIASRTDIILAAIPWVGWILLLAASWVPLQAIQPMIHEVAGKNTNVTISISISVVINILLSGTYFVQRRTVKRQQKELTRLRGRLEEIDRNRILPPSPPSR